MSENPQILTGAQLQAAADAAKTPEPRVTADAVMDAISAQPGEPFQYTIKKGPKAGTVVTLQEPAKPIAIVIAKAAGFQSINPGLTDIYEALYRVRKVGMAPVPAPENGADFDQILALIGDEGLNEIYAELRKHRATRKTEEVEADAVKK